MSRVWSATVAGMSLVWSIACSSSPPPASSAGSAADHAGHGAADAAAPRTTLLGNLGSYSRAIRTTNTEAQQFFDEGLTLLYGFNHDESFRSFARAAALDDRAPMPHWGMALALGTNINDPAPADRLARAYTHLAAAQARAANGSPVEQALIAALSKRYVANPTGDQAPREQAYSDAMGEVAKAYPDDPDAATLYAESLMNLRPWRLYDAKGAPAPGTDAIVATLERVMASHPDHPGANHYYIHAVEASNQPDRATRQAERLETLVPGAGHLVHMPAHIYIRTGQYARSAKSNADAARVDEGYFKVAGQQGMYPAMYYGHNLQFESAAAMFAGHFAEAREAARQTVALVDPIGDASPMLEPYALQDGAVLLRFGRFDEVLALKAPAPTRTVQTALYHFMRGAAYAGQGKVADADARAAGAGGGDGAGGGGRDDQRDQRGPRRARRGGRGSRGPHRQCARRPGGDRGGVHQRGGRRRSPQLQRTARLAAGRARAAGRGAAGAGPARRTRNRCSARTSRATSATRDRCSGCGRASTRRRSRTRQRRDARSRPRSQGADVSLGPDLLRHERGDRHGGRTAK